MTEFDKFLGMNRPITRRDFLQGMALGVAGAALACQRPPRVNAAVRPAFYPPEASGLRGQDMASTQLGHLVRDDVYLNQNENSVDTGEAYDLIVIGAGLSGLSAVHVYQQAQKNARILLLDNHDDFGGHARRNTFHWNDSTLIAPGGTFALEDVDVSPPQAIAML
ncbi:NAD(P)/FAD-dependent oxidoreductase, partial [Cytophagia bacterium CHB2]|nr:NAD(P)/FAD-dependent oxidoreductase [Cytophagia bacterium CHB2]